MGTRREARECALQMLYEIEMAQAPLEQVIAGYWARHPDHDAQTREFSDRLVNGVFTQKEMIDELIVKYSAHWRLSRMAAVDKNILRLAVFELKDCEDIPLKVSLNEAIEIAKKFGSEESGSFINGVLDKIGKELKKG
ncbi:MAG: transcription antitermination factor NusB [Deltaproteobacteria bacterium]|nr:transcription antitermination factor NusB [Deltaproteobacteria bacterium]